MNQVICWGEIGHRITAAIAEQYLTKDATNSILKILANYPDATGKPFTSLVDLSTYADDFRPQFSWSSAFHFINMDPKVIQYSETVQCYKPFYCITKALQNYTSILRDQKVTNPLQKGQAHAFLIHLLADVTQPLHVGNPGDVGGNNINLTLSSSWQTSVKSSNLHSLWDTLILQNWMNIEGIRNDFVKGALKFLAFIEMDQEFKNEYLYKIVPNPIQMTEDTRVICLSKVYEPLSNYSLNNLPMTYYTNSFPVVKSQIMKSGLQMASLLNDIFINNI